MSETPVNNLAADLPHKPPPVLHISLEDYLSRIAKARAEGLEIALRIVAREMASAGTPELARIFRALAQQYGK
jgi:malonyl CoA-acyl carrier protein transacylase